MPKRLPRAARHVAKSVVPDGQKITGRIPFNLIKSEKLGWVLLGADYFERAACRFRKHEMQLS